jgi:hypothetical protein
VEKAAGRKYLMINLNYRRPPTGDGSQEGFKSKYKKEGMY